MRLAVRAWVSAGMMALAVGLALPVAAHPMSYVGVVPVTFPAGHIAPDAGGGAAILVVDNLFSPQGASYCNAAVCPGLSLSSFCGAIGLGVGLNWNPALPVTIVVDGGALGGDPDPCFIAPFNLPGTTGQVYHT